MTAIFLSKVPCEKFSRKTSTPARIISRITGSRLDAGPSVATILARRCATPSDGLNWAKDVKDGSSRQFSILSEKDFERVNGQGRRFLLIVSGGAGTSPLEPGWWQAGSSKLSRRQAMNWKRP